MNASEHDERHTQLNECISPMWTGTRIENHAPNVPLPHLLDTLGTRYDFVGRYE